MIIKHKITGEVIFDGANLYGADLCNADLYGADLRNADLRTADLHGANLDFSCWPLWCGSSGVKVDKEQARQLLSHAFNVSQKYCKPTKKQKDFMNEFDKIQSKEFPRFE